jgi:hypothetical protein
MILKRICALKSISLRVYNFSATEPGGGNDLDGKYRCRVSSLL